MKNWTLKEEEISQRHITLKKMFEDIFVLAHNNPVGNTSQILNTRILEIARNPQFLTCNFENLRDELNDLVIKNSD